MTLSYTQPDHDYIVVSVKGDRRFLSRIASVGLTPGCKITVLQNLKRRPVLVYTRNTQLALDRDDCAAIQVEVA